MSAGPHQEPVGVGIVGCGKIAGFYLEQLNRQPDVVRIVGGCDAVPERAKELMERYGATAFASYDELLAAPDIGIVVNLTIQQVHADVTARALRAGKHVHSEKPLATSRDDGRALLALARERNLKLACSPFNSMGEAQSLLIEAVRRQNVGRPLAAYAEMNHGPIEKWNPRPRPFFQKGAGPLLDVGIYPLTILLAALGSVERVTGMARTLQPDRIIQNGPDEGQTLTVETPDQVVAGLDFASGAFGRLTASFRSGRSKQANGVEIHGETGSLALASSIDFAAEVERYDHETDEWTILPHPVEPFEGLDWGRGVRDLAEAIRQDRAPVCSAERAYHALDVCLGILESAERGQRLDIESRIDSIDRR